MKLKIILILLLFLALPLNLYADLSNGLVGYWSFDDGTATDNSGNGNNGAIYGATLVAGVSGQALSFDGENDNVAVPDSSSLHFGTNSFSFSMWLSASTFQGNNRPLEGIRVIDKGASYPQTWWVIDITPAGRIQMEMGDSSGVVAASNSNDALTRHSWYHIVIVVDREDFEVAYYINALFSGTGNLPDTFTGNLDVAGVTVDIGSARHNDFNGMLDEIRIYNRALNTSEIQMLYDFSYIPNISNVTVSQRSDNSKLVDIFYDLSDTDSNTCTITIEVSDDGGANYTVPAVNFTGDIGLGIKPGTGKHIIWDCKADLPGVIGSNYKIRVIADDGN